MSEFLAFVETMTTVSTGTLDKDTLTGVIAIAATIFTCVTIVK